MNRKVRLVVEALKIDEVVEVEKWIQGEMLLNRKSPRRFEFVSTSRRWDFQDKRYHFGKLFEGWIKNNKGYWDAVVYPADETETQNSKEIV